MKTAVQTIQLTKLDRHGYPIVQISYGSISPATPAKPLERPRCERCRPIYFWQPGYNQGHQTGTMPCCAG